MREIKTEIQISSKPEKVWEILIDLPNWSKWNPIVNKIEGNLEVGGKLFIIMCDKEGKAGRSYTSVVTAFDKNKCLRFVGKMMANFMFSADRIIELKDSNGGTLFIQREIYSGFMVPLFWKKLNEFALPMLHSMNKGLKKRVEN